MIAFLKDKASTIFLVLFIATLSPFVAGLFIKQRENKLREELYTPELTRLNTFDKLQNYCDSVYASENGAGMDTAKYVSVMSRVIKERFHHGSLNYSFSENWIAWVAGKLVWSHMSSIVIPEDILKHSAGLCSQQTIVFMELINRKNIDVRSIGLGKQEGPGHFLCEVRYQGSWHLHDVSFEPEWDRLVNHHQSMEYYLGNRDSLFKAYETKMPREVFFTILKKTDFGPQNKMPARNMRLFHGATYHLTWLLPVLFFFLFAVTYRRKKTQSHLSLAEERRNEENILVNATAK